VTNDELLVRVAGTIDLLVDLVAFDLDPDNVADLAGVVRDHGRRILELVADDCQHRIFGPKQINSLAGNVLCIPQGRMTERRIAGSSVRSDDLPDRLIRV
jgi:hypothetical protein